tara:strand:- start:245 stop:415 length:171 start_codon:yes stop_codon:yes gene_type:complete
LGLLGGMMIENWTSKIEKSNSAYDEARIVEQWSMDFLNRAGWNEIVEDTLKWIINH